VGILGGGVGGLSAAHELAERGFDVTVFEWREHFGGKARSMPVPKSGENGKQDLPAEHGFRFFPGFYRHVIDTMGRIPCRGGTVSRHLVDAKRTLMAQGDGKNELIVPTEPPSSISDVGVLVQAVWDIGVRVGVPMWEQAWFIQRLLTLLMSCDERRLKEWEYQSWWDFLRADSMSEEFQKFFADGTRTLVAARGREMSARTGGLIACQLLFGNMLQPGTHVDRLLDGPTSDVWIDPWRDYLKGRGVTLRNNCKVTGIDCDGDRVTGVTIEGPNGQESIVCKHYVAALPVEQLIPLVTGALRRAEPRLGKLSRLRKRWMNGAMFYLDKDVALQRGHTIFMDSEWALTAISQAQFWSDVNLEDYGDGNVDGILSVDISEWERASNYTGLTARETPSADEICKEVWRQMEDHIDDGSLLGWENVRQYFLDPAIHRPNPSEVTNLEPLLINTEGSWDNRPEAVTNIPNFFLAADFVRTHTDLATMEAANEAARRAVNGILDAEGSSASRCMVKPLAEPWQLAPFRALDAVRWRLERPVRPLVKAAASGALTLTGLVASGMRVAAGRSG
jgi:uncharacterized protein with NAD-binding domain and iron-sulfur cluster